MTITERRLDLIEAALRWQSLKKFTRERGPAHNVDDEGYHHVNEDGKLEDCAACKAERRLSRAVNAYSKALHVEVEKGFHNSSDKGIVE